MGRPTAACRGFRFLRSADFADHHHRLGLGIGLEQFKDIPERAAIDGIAADADAGRNTKAASLKLCRGLVAERAGSPDDADRAGFVDMPGHARFTGMRLIAACQVQAALNPDP